MRVADISKHCHNFYMFSTSVGLEWSLCRGKLAVPGHKWQRESPPGSLGRSIPCRGNSRNIEF